MLHLHSCSPHEEDRQDRRGADSVAPLPPRATGPICGAGLGSGTSAHLWGPCSICRGTGIAIESEGTTP